MITFRKSQTSTVRTAVVKKEARVTAKVVEDGEEAVEEAVEVTTIKVERVVALLLDQATPTPTC